MDKLRVGFIGAGRIADLHAIEYLQNERAELVAVCDADGRIARARCTTTTAATFVRGNKAPASTSVPEALASAGTYVRTVTIFAQRASRVANAASVYIDSTSGDGTQQIELVPGTSITITALDGKVIDLGSIYVDSTTLTDGVYYFGLL